MNASKLVAATLFLGATFVSGSASATIRGESYYVPGDTSYLIQQSSTLDRAAVKADTRVVMRSIQAHQPRTEFGAGSHDTSGSIRSRGDVKSEAVHYERGSAHVPFSY
jgi:hypothetical protein